MAPRLLIVDDEPDICAFLGRIGEESGYNVVTANRAEEFKRAFTTADCDVILLDLTMPGTDGIELLKYLAEMGTRARVLIISGNEPYIRTMAFKIGAARGLDMAGELPKPLRVREIKGILDQLRREAEEPK